MNQKLWEVIQLFKEKEAITTKDWAYAQSVLEPEVFQLLQLQFDGTMNVVSKNWK